MSLPPVRGSCISHLAGISIVAITDRHLQIHPGTPIRGFAPHAGLRGHSRLLHVRPDLVNPAYRSAQDCAGTDWESLVEIAREADWRGYFGAPRHTSAAFGARAWEALSTAAIDLALKILDGLDPTEIPRLGTVARSVPANVAIDSDALARDTDIEGKQRAWLKQNGSE